MVEEAVAAMGLPLQAVKTNNMESATHAVVLTEIVMSSTQLTFRMDCDNIPAPAICSIVSFQVPCLQVTSLGLPAISTKLYEGLLHV
jgi:hypothetical protein